MSDLRKVDLQKALRIFLILLVKRLCSHITQDCYGCGTAQASLKIRAETVTAKEIVLDSFSCSFQQLSYAEYTKEMLNVPQLSSHL